jgi:DNA polymerase I-like protein with 3'-5' exonuclease and polymerase domains
MLQANKGESLMADIIETDITKIERLIAAQYAEGLTKNIDIHIQTAAKMFSKPYEEVTAAEREVGKKANYYKMYYIPEEKV